MQAKVIDQFMVVSQTLTKEAKFLAQKIAETYKPEKIILFGSASRGQGKTDSDIDLLIIKKSTKKRPFRIKEVFEALRGVKRTFSLDAIVYTPEEVKQRLALGDYFIQTVLTKGQVLYD